PGTVLSRKETCLLKTQTPSTKHQTPNSNETPSSKLQVRSAVGSLELGISLVFGAWFLVFQFPLGPCQPARSTDFPFCVFCAFSRLNSSALIDLQSDLSHVKNPSHSIVAIFGSEGLF